MSCGGGGAGGGRQRAEGMGGGGGVGRTEYTCTNGRRGRRGAERERGEEGEKREGHQKSVGMQEHDGIVPLQKAASKVGRIPPILLIKEWLKLVVCKLR